VSNHDHSSVVSLSPRCWKEHSCRHIFRAAAALIGFEPRNLTTDREIVDWDVPLLSHDFEGAVLEIHRRAELLAGDLHTRK
jgi:hypothetical protein